MKLSTTATLGKEESGHCREAETRVNVWTVRQKNGCPREVAIRGGSRLYLDFFFQATVTEKSSFSHNHQAQSLSEEE